MTRAWLLIALAACSNQTSSSPKPDPGATPKKVEARTKEPPSTGRELAANRVVAPKKADPKLVVADLVKASATTKPDCADVTYKLTEALPLAYPTMQAEAVPAEKLLQACATEAKHWRAAAGAGLKLLAFDPDEKTVSQIPRALAELGEYDKALALGKDLIKHFPKYTDSIRNAMVFTYCVAGSWSQCGQGANQSLAKVKDPHSTTALLDRYFRDLAWVVMGKPKEAMKDAAAMKKVGGEVGDLYSAIDPLAKQAIARGFYMELVEVPQLTTGIYHLMGKRDMGSLVTLKFFEHTGKSRRFRVEAEVPGVTVKMTSTVLVGAKKSVVAYVNPPLKMDFDVTKVRGPRPSLVALKVIEETPTGDKIITEDNRPIDVLPRDYLPLYRKVGADSSVPTYNYIGAWITSNDKTVDDFLSKAKQRVEDHAFAGEQRATIPQVKAIYNELKARGMSYVEDPPVSSRKDVVQRTRLPGDVLRSTNAQCLEGTIAFATLLEAIALDPVVVIVPGHAFLGWHTTKADGMNGDWVYVETTAVGSASFEEAVAIANHRVKTETAADNFKKGVSTYINLREAHANGFTAQPI